MSHIEDSGDGDSRNGGDAGGRGGEDGQALPHAHGPERTRDLILAALDRPWMAPDLAAELDIDPDELDRFVAELAHHGAIIRQPDGAIARPGGRTAAGFFARRQRGSGYVIPDDRTVPLVSIPDGMEGGALPGDRVLAQLQQTRKGKRESTGGRGRSVAGRIIAIVAERPTLLTGVVERSPYGELTVSFSGKNKPREARLELERGQTAEPGQIVRVDLPRGRGGRGRSARLVEAVSHVREASDDAATIAGLFEFPIDFSDVALAELETLPADPAPDEYRDRLDLRGKLIITIDPADAKDHDDAISLDILPGGLFQLGVHIADVSRYVPRGSDLDAEAFERGTSVYLPGKTIPMLPPKLSAGLCSLMEGRERLTKSCFLTYDRSGRLLRRELYRSAIRVGRFLNYEQALAVLEKRASISPEIDGLLLRSRELADRLNERRLDNGSLVLNISRPHLVVDKGGHIVSIEVDRQDPSHNLIEEFMIAANCAVASFMLDRGLPYISRIHPPPEEEAQEEFAEFCQQLGMPAPDFGESRRVQLFLDGIKGRPGETAIHLAVLKSMKRAEYSFKPALHYALALKEYTHFTSPIRRLCDLVVHQIIDAYWSAGGVLKHQERALPGLAWADGEEAPARDIDGRELRHARGLRLQMQAIARRATETSDRSERAEIQTTQLKLLRAMEARLGEEFMGTVVHISNAGLILQLDGVWAEGTLFFYDLSTEWVTARKYWVEFETRDGSRSARVGDRLRVVATQVDLGARTLRLVPAESASYRKERGGAAFIDFRQQRAGGDAAPGAVGTGPKGMKTVPAGAASAAPDDHAARRLLQRANARRKAREEEKKHGRKRGRKTGKGSRKKRK